MRNKVKEKSEIKLSGKYFEAVGRRKRAIARVRLYGGGGKFIINGKEAKINDIAFAPLFLLGKDKQFDLSVKIKGGGFNSQKEAIRLGVARCLVKSDQSVKTTLRKAGFLTRDPREKERKKPGLKRARKAPQWQKR